MMARAGCVRLCLHGHDHEGGSAVVDGIRYITMPGVVEGTQWSCSVDGTHQHSAPPGGNAYAVMHVFADGGVQVEAYGFQLKE